MEQTLSLVTLGVADLGRARRFYIDGLGWKPVFANTDITFFQMNGLVLGLWLARELEADMRRPAGPGPAAFALAHNVRTREEVEPVLARAVAAGGRLLRPAAELPWGGLSGYFADPDGHAWDVAWNPAWTMDAEGHVRFGA